MTREKGKAQVGKSAPSLISYNAARLRELNARVMEAFSRKPHGPEHKVACEAFHAQYDQLAFPGGLERGLALLSEKDPDTVDTAIAFLEADPRFFRSGYIKEKLLSRLKHVALSQHQVKRLGRLAIRSVDSGGRREFHGYARLAGALHAHAIAEAMHERQSSRDPEVARRAREVLHVLASRAGMERSGEGARLSASRAVLR